MEGDGGAKVGQLPAILDRSRDRDTHELLEQQPLEPLLFLLDLLALLPALFASPFTLLLGALLLVLDPLALLLLQQRVRVDHVGVGSSEGCYTSLSLR